MCLQSNIKFNLRLSQSFFFLEQYLHKVLFPAKSSCILSYTLNHMCKGAFFICLYLRYFTVAGMLCQDIFNSFTPSLNSALIWLVLKQVYQVFTCLKSSVPWNIAAHILLLNPVFKSLRSFDYLSFKLSCYMFYTDKCTYIVLQCLKTIESFYN